MATVELRLRVRYRWWFWPYINTLKYLCDLFDADPDWEKLDRMIKRGIILEVR